MKEKRRKLLKSLALGGFGSVALPQTWSKPVVQSLVLPAHGQTTVPELQSTLVWQSQPEWLPMIAVQTQIRTYEVRNPGQEAVTITNIRIRGDDAAKFQVTSSNCTGTLLPNASCSFMVRLDTVIADAGRKIKGRLSVEYSGGNEVPLDSDKIEIPMGPPGRLAWSTLPAWVPMLAGQSQSRSYTVENVGTTSVTVTSIFFGGGSDSRFTVSADFCSSVPLLPGNSCSFSVWATSLPVDAGTTLSAEVIVTYSGGEGSPLDSATINIAIS